MRLITDQRLTAAILAAAAALLVGLCVAPDAVMVRAILGTIGAIVALSAGATLWLRQSRRAALRTTPDGIASLHTATQSNELEQLRSRLVEELQAEADRLEERERDLAERFARFHEFIEYPAEDLHRDHSTTELHRLSENDRAVNALLEAEAERVYEKIRSNGYSIDGRVDLDAIREEALSLITRVARIYAPESSNPLLETSFEQLARAASRICLQLLVLLEQLPLGVQKYNINSLYGYLRKAVVGYGTYQKAAPWLTYLSRGLYAGRLASASNPITLGAWWLASELGRQGARRLVENVVDRQAIAILHDLVTVIGVEVAGIYGTGFRQRDPEWIYGTELTELISAFPGSRDSLQEGLRQVTALRLRSEYDRIYLYRCLAGHRAAGLQLSDPAMLTREQRETIAGRLEQFFATHIHGASAKPVREWSEGFENRFDLRLKLGTSHPSDTTGTAAILAAVRSLQCFAEFVLNADRSMVVAALTETECFQVLPADAQQRYRADTDSSAVQVNTAAFEPPAIDPSAPLTDQYLRDLALLTTQLHEPADSVEQLVCETGAWFRRTPEEMRTALARGWQQQLAARAVTSAPSPAPSGLAARTLLTLMAPGEILNFCYDNVSLLTPQGEQQEAGLWLAGLSGGTDSKMRTLLISESTEPALIWQASGQLALRRDKGLLIDDAVVTGGQWLRSPEGHSNSGIRLAGSLRGGRFSTYFAPLLARAG